MNRPLVSIIMPCYNASAFVADALNSILNQSYHNIEIVAVNDGSTDNTDEILKGFIKQGVIVLNQTNKGQDAALNYGYKNSKGDYIKFMDSDDVINEKMIEIQVNALQLNPTKVAYSEWYRFFGKIPTERDTQKKMYYWRDTPPIDFLLEDQDGPMLQCGIMMIPRPVIEKAGLWDERLILYNDTEFFTRIILQSGGVVFTPGAKLFYRSGTNTSLSAQSSRKYFESTYLASNLIEEHLLKVESSERVRKLLANIYFRRLYEMYPWYKDLALLHTKKITLYGPPDLDIRGGKLHNFLFKYFGWVSVKRAHQLKKFLRK